MRRLFKSKHLIMIALLSCFMNLSISSFATNPSTGGVKQDSLTNDSVLIAYSDLRKVNAKLIELEYEQEINANLRHIIVNDSVAILSLNNRIRNMANDNKLKVQRIKRQRNVLGGVSIASFILLVISIL